MPDSWSHCGHESDHAVGVDVQPPRLLEPVPPQLHESCDGSQAASLIAPPPAVIARDQGLMLSPIARTATSQADDEYAAIRNEEALRSLTERVEREAHQIQSPANWPSDSASPVEANDGDAHKHTGLVPRLSKPPATVSTAAVTLMQVPLPSTGKDKAPSNAVMVDGFAFHSFSTLHGAHGYLKEVAHRAAAGKSALLPQKGLAGSASSAVPAPATGLKRKAKSLQERPMMSRLAPDGFGSMLPAAYSSLEEVENAPADELWHKLRERGVALGVGSAGDEELLLRRVARKSLSTLCSTFRKGFTVEMYHGIRNAECAVQAANDALQHLVAAREKDGEAACASTSQSHPTSDEAPRLTDTTPMEDAIHHPTGIPAADSPSVEKVVPATNASARKEATQSAQQRPLQRVEVHFPDDSKIRIPIFRGSTSFVCATDAAISRGYEDMKMIRAIEQRILRKG